MNAQEITYAPDADPAVVAKIEIARAKLKPRCMRCGKVLPKKDLPARLCSNREDCTRRAICSFRAPKLVHLYERCLV